MASFSRILLQAWRNINGLEARCGLIGPRICLEELSSSGHIDGMEGRGGPTIHARFCLAPFDQDCILSERLFLGLAFFTWLPNHSSNLHRFDRHFLQFQRHAFYDFAGLASKYIREKSLRLMVFSVRHPIGPAMRLRSLLSSLRDPSSPSGFSPTFSGWEKRTFGHVIVSPWSLRLRLRDFSDGLRLPSFQQQAFSYASPGAELAIGT